MAICFVRFFLLWIFLSCLTAFGALAQDAQTILQEAFDYYRGNSSWAEVEMTIHRPDWERTMSLKAWSKGRQDGLFLVTAPAKDKGNGTLKKGREMWTYSPKINRVIKIPPSLMSQSWMGSDFSNNDLAKSDTIIEDYSHELAGVETQDGHKIYSIKSVPKPFAPVVWGMQTLKIRDDYILLQESFYDEDLKLVKEMIASQIGMLGGKLFPKVWVMRKAENPNEYTRLIYKEAAFDVEIPDSFFTVSNLKSPRIQ